MSYFFNYKKNLTLGMVRLFNEEDYLVNKNNR